MTKGYHRFNMRMLHFQDDLEMADAAALRQEPAMSHLRDTLCQSFIKELYDETTAYVHYVLEQAVRGGADVAKLKDRDSITIVVNHILHLSTKEEIMAFVHQQIMSDLLKRSTRYLIANLNKKLGLTVDKALISDALPYLECRRYLAEADGVLPADFIATHPDFPSSGGRIAIDSTFAKTAFNAVNKLLSTVDQQVIEKAYIPKAEILS